MNFDPVVILNILRHLDYESIINTCHSMPEFDRVCQDPYLWEVKASDDFGISKQAFNDLPARDNLDRYELLMDIKPDRGLIIATIADSPPLADYFIKQGADNFSSAIDRAVVEGNFKIFKHLLPYADPILIQSVAELAARRGKRRIVDYLLDNKKIDLTGVAFSAIEGNETGIFDDVVKRGFRRDLYNDALLLAARNGSNQIIDRLVNLGANNLNAALMEAVEEGKFRTVNQLIDLGANRLNEALLQASYRGYIKTIELLIEKGANNLQEALKIAVDNNQNEAAKVIMSYLS